MHAAINYAYAARHGYHIYYADVRGCVRHPSWCVKLCAYSLLFERWEEWTARPTCEAAGLESVCLPYERVRTAARARPSA